MSEYFIDTPEYIIKRHEEFVNDDSGNYPLNSDWTRYYIDKVKDEVYNVKHQYFQRDVLRNNRNNYPRNIYVENYKEVVGYDINIRGYGEDDSPFYAPYYGKPNHLYLTDESPSTGYDPFYYQSFVVKFKEDKGVLLCSNVDDAMLAYPFYRIVDGNLELVY